MSDTANNKNPDPDIAQAKADILRAHDIMPPYDKPSSSKPEPEDQSDIPTFDLAENILANQRKVASGKRKSPPKPIEAAKPTPPIPIVEYKPAAQAPAPPPQPDSVIAQIVARDIERLRRFGC